VGQNDVLHDEFPTNYHDKASHGEEITAQIDVFETH
jgi:hypothetical protein